MNESTDAQDAFAELVAQCRSCTVQRIILGSGLKPTKYVPFNPHLDLNIPVFYENVAPSGLFGDEYAAGYEALQEGRFRLPYPRCGFLTRVAEDHPTLKRAPQPYAKPTGRYYFALLEEAEDGIAISSFMRHDSQRYWSQQVWQARLTATEREIAYDPVACAQVKQEFLNLLHESNVSRVDLLVAAIQKITTGKGTMTPAEPGPATQRINDKRAKAGLPEVSRVRVLCFDPVQPGPPRTGKKGTKKPPHFRRGGWRTLPSGKQTWVTSSAIHGGTADVPPWYEIRAKPPG